MLGITQASVSKAGTKGRVPAGWVVTISNKTGYSSDWLIYGEGPKTRTEKGIAAPPDNKNTQKQLEKLQAEIRGLNTENKNLLRDINELTGKLYEKAIDPERDFVIPVVGLAECGMKGWNIQSITSLHTAAPVDIATADGGFAVVAIGDSMIPAGVEPGFICFCNPEIAPAAGDMVFVEREKSFATVKIYAGETRRKNTEFVALQDWLPINKKNPDEPQKPFTLEIEKSQVKRIATVVYVKRRL